MGRDGVELFPCTGDPGEDLVGCPGSCAHSTDAKVRKSGLGIGALGSAFDALDPELGLIQPALAILRAPEANNIVGTDPVEDVFLAENSEGH